MSSVHLYNAEKNDIEDVYNLLVEFKKVDLVDFNYPEIDRTKVIKFLHTILQKGQIILLKYCYWLLYLLQNRILVF